MLPHPRPGPGHRQRRPRHRPRLRWHLRPALLRVLVPHEESPGRQVLVVVQIGIRERGHRPHPRPLQRLHRLQLRALPGPLLDYLVQRVFVFLPGRNRGEPRVPGQFLPPDGRAKLLPFLLAPHRNAGPFVIARAPVDPVWGHIRGPVAHPPRLRPIHRVLHQLLRLEPDDRLLLRQVDVLPPARSQPVVKGRQYRRRARHTPRGIGHLHPVRHRFAVGISHGSHQPRDVGHVHPVRNPPRPRPVRPKPRERRHDYLRVHLD